MLPKRIRSVLRGVPKTLIVMFAFFLKMKGGEVWNWKKTLDNWSTGLQRPCSGWKILFEHFQVIANGMPGNSKWFAVFFTLRLGWKSAGLWQWGAGEPNSRFVGAWYTYVLTSYAVVADAPGKTSTNQLVPITFPIRAGSYSWQRRKYNQ